MIILKKYTLQFDIKNNIYLVRADEKNICPLCLNERLYAIGSRRRKYYDSDGAKITLLIRRLRCGRCRKIHHELPDIITPYKRHCTQTINSILNHDTEKLCCEGSTIKRIELWWKLKNSKI